MPFSNLSPQTQSSINIAEDTRNAKVCNNITIPAGPTPPTTPLITANANRATYSIYNLGPNPVLMREGATVSTTVYEAIIPVGYYWYPDPGEPRYLGAISLMANGGASNCQICEATLA
jgi:hypothetical protein